MKIDIITKAIAELCRKHSIQIGSAESCTGGRIAHEITKLSGSSAYFKGSIVSYQEEIKTAILNIPQDIIEKYTPESKEVVSLMSINVKELLNLDYSVATSGRVGPKTYIRPADGVDCCFVYVSVSGPNGTRTKLHTFNGVDRIKHIKQATKIALELLYSTLLDDLVLLTL